MSKPRTTAPIPIPGSHLSKRIYLRNWNAGLTAALAEGIVANRVFDWSSVNRNNLTFTGEFELPGGVAVRFESRPSAEYWGAVDLRIVVAPRPVTKLNERPGDVLPFSSPRGLRQGQATALGTIYLGSRKTPDITLLYVHHTFRRRWQHVCNF